MRLKVGNNGIAVYLYEYVDDKEGNEKACPILKIIIRGVK